MTLKWPHNSFKLYPSTLQRKVKELLIESITNKTCYRITCNVYDPPSCFGIFAPKIFVSLKSKTKNRQVFVHNNFSANYYYLHDEIFYRLIPFEWALLHLMLDTKYVFYIKKKNLTLLRCQCTVQYLLFKYECLKFRAKVDRKLLGLFLEQKISRICLQCWTHWYCKNASVLLTSSFEKCLVNWRYRVGDNGSDQ